MWAVLAGAGGGQAGAQLCRGPMLPRNSTPVWLEWETEGEDLSPGPDGQLSWAGLGEEARILEALGLPSSLQESLDSH